MTKNYASLLPRIKAVVVDGIVAIIYMYAITYLFEQFESVSNSFRVAAFLTIFVLYEPVLVSVFGATVGHFFNDISVKRINNQEKNLMFHIALLRYLIKFFLGWVSLLTIHSNDYNQAIHDMVAGSVVITSD